MSSEAKGDRLPLALRKTVLHPSCIHPEAKRFLKYSGRSRNSAERIPLLLLSDAFIVQKLGSERPLTVPALKEGRFAHTPIPFSNFDTIILAEEVSPAEPTFSRLAAKIAIKARPFHGGGKAPLRSRSGCLSLDPNSRGEKIRCPLIMDPSIRSAPAISPGHTRTGSLSFSCLSLHEVF